VLSGGASLAVLAAVAAVAVEWRAPHVIDPVYHARLTHLRHGLAADAARARSVIFLGTSRTYEGVKASRLSRRLSDDLGRPVTAVQWGIPESGFVTCLLTWRRLRRDGVRPDLLLVEVMPGLFQADRPGQLRDDLLPASRLDHFDLPLLERYRGDTRPDLGRQVVLAEAGTLYSRRYALARALSPALVPAYDDEGCPFAWQVEAPGSRPEHPSPEVRRKALAHAEEEYRGLLGNFRPARCEALRELLRSCRAAGIPAALLLMPEGLTYRSWYGPETGPNIKAWLDDVAAEFGVGVIDARDWMTEEDFRDSHHLLRQAAVVFTERLGREHILPVLRRLP
jgi:hypothetical protein